MSVMPVQAVGGLMPNEIAAPATQAYMQPQASFGRMLVNGINGVSYKLSSADATARAFALDDSIPVHQVTYALEQARLSFELMLQVRSRLLEGYQQLMNMQL